MTAAIGFLLVAAAVYLVLVYPMNKLNERMARRKGLNAEEAEVSDEVRLLTEIRDALAGGGYMNGGGTAGGGYTGGGYRHHSGSTQQLLDLCLASTFQVFGGASYPRGPFHSLARYCS